MSEGNEWAGLADWWRDELVTDPAYVEDVLPLLLELADPKQADRVVDLGCGEGRVMAAIAQTGAVSFGCDINLELAVDASRHGPTVQLRLPELAAFRSGIFDLQVAVLVLEHVDDLPLLFRETARLAAGPGRLVTILNHPLFTAPGSAPVTDPTDGEVYWRWGTYLEEGVEPHDTGGRQIMFRHRPLGVLLTAAAEAGWALDRMIEKPTGPAGAALMPVLAQQPHIPRLMGVRWRVDEP